MGTRSAIFACLIASVALAGCATWSTSSVKPTAEGKAAHAVPNRALSEIVITENDITDKPYVVLADISVDVNKTTLFNKDPTREQADQKLREKAAELGADAVVLVRYGTVGVGLMSWGSLNAKGRAVKFK